MIFLLGCKDSKTQISYNQSNSEVEFKTNSESTISSEVVGFGVNELLRVGSIGIYQEDLDFYLKQKYSDSSNQQTKDKALEELVRKARHVQAALHAGLDKDAAFRANTAHALSVRLREEVLDKQFKEKLALISEADLQAIYKAQIDRFQSPEKRQVAVLWLNPGPSPERKKNYEEKMSKAREWFLNNESLTKKIEKGFSVLSVDNSEHVATRYQGGVLGWVQKESGNMVATDDWRQAVTDIVFSIGTVGEISQVITRPEGIFLVRLMAIKPAIQKSFESVRAQLARNEKSRLRKQLQDDFEQTLVDSYPIITAPVSASNSLE